MHESRRGRTRARPMVRAHITPLSLLFFPPLSLTLSLSLSLSLSHAYTHGRSAGCKTNHSSFCTNSGDPNSNLRGRLASNVEVEEEVVIVITKPIARLGIHVGAIVLAHRWYPVVCCHTYVCIYVHIRMYVCMYICMYVCMYVSIYLYMCICVCMFVCIHVCMYVCMYICMCVCSNLCLSVCMYVCIHACVYW